MHLTTNMQARIDQNLVLWSVLSISLYRLENLNHWNRNAKQQFAEVQQKLWPHLEILQVYRCHHHAAAWCTFVIYLNKQQQAIGSVIFNTSQWPLSAIHLFFFFLFFIELSQTALRAPVTTLAPEEKPCYLQSGTVPLNKQELLSGRSIYVCACSHVYTRTSAEGQPNTPPPAVNNACKTR